MVGFFEAGTGVSKCSVQVQCKCAVGAARKAGTLVACSCGAGFDGAQHPIPGGAAGMCMVSLVWA